MATESGRVVLVTGVSRPLARTFASRLAADPAVDRVVGVDVIPPRGDIGEVNFIRADIRSPIIAKVIAHEGIDTVVHMSVIATPGSAGARGTMKELNVIGTMQLLAACQQAEQVRRFVLKSTTTMYGASPRDPAMFTEDMQPKRPPASGYAKDVAEVEGYVRALGRRRPDIDVTTLRCANVIGPRVVSPVTSYFRLGVVPTVLGYDPRLQFLHESDLHRVLTHAVHESVPGTFNVAGDGIITLSQALRRMQRPRVAVPSFALGQVGSALKSAQLAELPPELRAFLTFGRGVDTTRMRTELGFEPTYSTAEAFAEFASTLRPSGGRAVRVVDALAERFPAEPRAVATVTTPGGTDG